MSDHPIEGLMTTAMQSIKEMVDVNTIVGDAVQTPDGTVIIPISKVCFGFAAGGGDYGQQSNGANSDSEGGSKLPFAGGSGAGVSINPVAFMVCGENHVKLLPVDMNTSLDKVLDLIPGLIEKINGTINSKLSNKKEHSNKKKNKDDDKDKEDYEE
ncbi:GerW family sporulation protein [Ruminiclostridium herbifermentans]|uniref:GerW family sporulation protein n=1 Tax=Ruminiclostridium herbifermentans TaxID=2488810 RepID=A0A4U7JIR2_9FIRM|nr:GerW family sporulation protein [Ruminiclostridium herbifermentans]QNU65328.1 GerW family sporulation protein [Ruminiclostridium herbifermentans]